MKNNISIFSECANCGACYNTCPVGAITLNINNTFYDLQVDESACINCGKCVKICPWNSEIPVQNLISAYGGWHNDKSVVANSSSGGVFSAIAEMVLKEKGVVFGAVFSEDKKKVVFGSTDEFSLDEIRRSKYVESCVGDSFVQVKKQLMLDRMVLYCGTPCQIAGLKRYLDRDYDNLITCDFACGGLPSHKIYSQYITKLEDTYKSKARNVNFRTKVFGWGHHGISVLFENKRKYVQYAPLDPYFYSYIYSHLTIRENCMNCKFANNHYSDLILADFWKYKDVSNFERNYKGISLILTNSVKGEKLVNKLKRVMTLEELNLETASYNCRKKEDISAEKIEKRKLFIMMATEESLKQLAIENGMSHGLNAFIKKKKVQLRLLIDRLGIKKI